MKNLEDTERYLINSFDEGDSLNSFRNLNSSTIYSDGAPIKLKELVHMIQIFVAIFCV